MILADLIYNENGNGKLYFTGGEQTVLSDLNALSEKMKVFSVRLQIEERGCISKIEKQIDERISNFISEVKRIKKENPMFAFSKNDSTKIKVLKERIEALNYTKSTLDYKKRNLWEKCNTYYDSYLKDKYLDLLTEMGFNYLSTGNKKGSEMHAVFGYDKDLSTLKKFVQKKNEYLDSLQEKAIINLQENYRIAMAKCFNDVEKFDINEVKQEWII